MTLHVVFSVLHIQIGTWRNPKVPPTIDVILDICNLCTHQSTEGIKAMSLAFSLDKQVIKVVYCIDTDKIPGFFLLLKNNIFIARSEDTIFIFDV